MNVSSPPQRNLWNRVSKYLKPSFYKELYARGQKIRCVGKEFVDVLNNAYTECVYKSPGLAGICETLDAQSTIVRDTWDRMKKSFHSLESLVRTGTPSSAFPLPSINTPTARTYDTQYTPSLYPYELVDAVVLYKNRHHGYAHTLVAERASDTPSSISLSEIVRYAMNERVQGRYDRRIDYDHMIAPATMKEEFIDAYIQSARSLRELSESFEKKYGMHISSKTLSKYARKSLHSLHGVPCHNRREWRRYLAQRHIT